MLKGLFALLSILSIYTGYFLYMNRPPIELLDRDINCKIFGGDHLQRGRCYRNALFIYLTSPEFRDTSLIAFQDLCNEGLYKACYAKDMLKKESSFNFSPFQEHIDIGNKDAIRCIDGAQAVDPFIKDYFCSKSQAYGKFLKDTFLISEIGQNWQPFTDKNYLLNIENNIIFDDKYNDDLFSKNCSSITSENQKQYCDKFKELDNLRRDLNKAIFDPKHKSLEKIIEIRGSICEKFKFSCYIVTENLAFLMETYKLYPSKMKLQMLDDFYLSFEKRLVFWQLVKQDNYLQPFSPKRKLDQIIQATFDRDYKKAAEICIKNNFRESEGCFLSFQTFQEAIRGQEKLNKFCENGDTFSCKMIKLIKHNNVLKISDDMPIYNLYFYYDDRILEAYLKSPLRNISLFLDRNRMKILSFALFALFALQIMIFVLFKKTGTVYDYIRQQTVDRIKNKIKRNDPD